LNQIVEFSRNRELKIWLLVIPRRDQVEGSEAGRAFNRKTAQIARRLNIPVADVLEALIAEYSREGRKLFIPWDGHNSGVANRVIARELAKRIATER
jgi:lysophospholipase L1-like esterase